MYDLRPSNLWQSRRYATCAVCLFLLPLSLCMCVCVCVCGLKICNVVLTTATRPPRDSHSTHDYRTAVESKSRRGRLHLSTAYNVADESGWNFAGLQQFGTNRTPCCSVGSEVPMLPVVLPLSEECALPGTECPSSCWLLSFVWTPVHKVHTCSAFSLLISPVRWFLTYARRSCAQVRLGTTRCGIFPPLMMNIMFSGFRDTITHVHAL